MQKKAQIVRDNDQFTLLQADHGDLDPTSDSKVGLLAGFHIVLKSDGSLHFVGTSLADVVQWIQNVQQKVAQS